MGQETSKICNPDPNKEYKVSKDYSEYFDLRKDDNCLNLIAKGKINAKDWEHSNGPVILEMQDGKETGKFRMSIKVAGQEVDAPGFFTLSNPWLIAMLVALFLLLLALAIFLLFFCNKRRRETGIYRPIHWPTELRDKPKRPFFLDYEGSDPSPVPSLPGSY